MRPLYQLVINIQAGRATFEKGVLLMSRDALIVGINQYQALPGLNAPAADAEAVAARLQTQGEFRVQRMPEVIKNKQATVGQRRGVTAQMLEDALIKLFKPKGKNIPNTAFFYFSGHGLQREAGIQEGYLATSDTNPSVGNFGISLNWLRRLLQQSPVRQIVVILDCCHSGELLTFRDADPGARAGIDRCFMAASREYESAYEALAGKHSVFTQALLSGLNPYQQEGGKVSNHALTEHISQQLRGELQQPLFENSGSEIVLTRVSGLKAAFSKTPISTFTRLKQLSFGFCPYRGLSPFDEAHADYFFGREALTDQLLTKIESSSFCALVGASSSGKTSLLRAGLAHHLRKGDRIPGSDRWAIKLITPTQHPIKGLAAAFAGPSSDDVQRASQMHQAESLLQDHGGSGLAQLIRAALMKPGETSIPSTSKLWLIIDQFEELFTCTSNASVRAERQRFIQCLVDTLQDPSIPLGIVIGLRADVTDELLPYPALKALVEKNTVLVTPMTYDQIKAVVQKPAQKMGIELDPTMLYTLTMDTNGAPGELALIQQTLLELWRRRDSCLAGSAPPKLTMDTYMALGGVKQVMTHRATTVYESLSEEKQRAARRIFLTLCELGEGREDHRRRALRSELVNENFPAELIDCTLDDLSAARLIVVSQASISTSCCTEQGTELPSATWQTQRDESSPLSTWFLNNVPTAPQPVIGSPRTLDIVHDSLINDWDLLRTWLAESRQTMRQQRRIERQAQEWAERQRPTSPEYLLGGTQLQEALAFLQLNRQDLSELAQDFVMTSRKVHNRLRLRTSMLIPIALIAGMAASLVSRFIFPAAPELPEAADVQPAATPSTARPGPQSQTNADPAQDTAVSPGNSSPEDSSLGIWQRRDSAATPTIPAEPPGPTEAPTPVIQMDPAVNSAIAEGDFVVVPAGKMPSPSNPDEEVEIWLIQPSGSDPMALEFEPTPEPAAVSSRD
ncbi:MAG: caspase family protein [Cyanobacteria bacterium J06627_32]